VWYMWQYLCAWLWNILLFGVDILRKSWNFSIWWGSVTFQFETVQTILTLSGLLSDLVLHLQVTLWSSCGLTTLAEATFQCKVGFSLILVEICFRQMLDSFWHLQKLWSSGMLRLHLIFTVVVFWSNVGLSLTWKLCSDQMLDSVP
jgi:hypothetical protein